MQISKQQLLTELVLKDIYKEIKVRELEDKDKIHVCEIYLGELDDHYHCEDKSSILDSLKKQKIISSYSTETVEEAVSQYNAEGKKDGSINEIFIKASIKLNPSKVIEYIKQILKEKEKLLNKLSKLLTEIIYIMRFYAKDPLSISEEMNQAYLQISKDINKLLKDELLYNFKPKYKKPFLDLFLAEVDVAIKELLAFLGEIKHQVSKIKAFIDGKIEVNVDEVLAKMEEQEKGYKEKIIIQKSKKKKIVPPKFPPNIKWENIIIKFITGHDVHITVKGEVYNTDYEAMGFQDEKAKKPNFQWALLKRLSKNNGEASWDNNADITKKEIDAIKHQKQFLSDSLKAFFQIDESPFYDYKKEKAYKIKINLIPESSFEEEKDDLGVKEYFKEQTPEVYEE